MIVGGWLYLQMQLYLKSDSANHSKAGEFKKNPVFVFPRTINYILGVAAGIWRLG